MLRKLSRRLRPLIFCSLLWLCCAGAAQGAIIINAPMTDTNSSGWVLGGNPNSAILTGNGSIDASGSGWLRLTNNTGDQTGFAYNTTSFDLSAGALIQFDYATWGGSGADGYSVYLFDANVPTFNIGAFGGSLGYAQKSATATCSAAPANVPGISGGYVGIGVDEFGNFAYGCEGRRGGTAQKANTVTVRGSVVGFGGGAVGSTQSTVSYPWIATSATSATSLWYNGTPRPGQFGTDYRKVIIRISPAPNPVADVWIQYGYNTTPVQMVTGQALPAISASQQLKIGYAASTGGSTNYHEIRNLLITTINQSTAIDLGVTKTAVATGTSTAITSALVGSSFDYLLTARNYGPNSVTATGVGITDNFPANLSANSWACTSAGGASCGAATGGAGNLATTATLPVNGSVTYRIKTTLNTLPAGNLLSNTTSLGIPGAVTDYFPNNNSATASISAYQAPTVVKSFLPASVPIGSPSALSVTLTNPNNIAATGVAFTDTYPAGLINAAAAVTPQCGGTVTAINNGTSLALSGGTIPANGSCTVTVNVDSATSGSFVNSTGAVTTSNFGNGTASTATLAVMAKPTLAKSFAPSQVGVNLPSVMTITLSNPNAVAVTLPASALTDSYPAGLVNTAAASGATTCTGGTVTAANGGNSLVLSGGTIPAGGSCTVTANVTSAAAGAYLNSTGALTTSNAGAGVAATATLTVLQAPTVAKSFAAPTVLPGGSSLLSVTLSNPNTTAISAAAFTDNYPAGLFNAATPGATTTCSGGTVSATSGGASLALAGATIPASGSCTVSVNVTSATAATYVNSTGAVTTGNAGNGSAASGTLVVMAPPTATKVFAPNLIGIGGTTVLTVTLNNPNSVAISGAGFTDSYPTNMKNTASPAAATSCTAGSVTAASGGPSVALSGGTIPAGGSCTVTVNVTITGAGTFNNTTGPIATANAGSGAAGTANLNGPQAPTVAQNFTQSNIPLGSNSVLTITLSNPNSFPITGAAFSDSYPAGLVNTAAASGATTCSGGTVTALNGGGALALAGGTIPAGGSCTVTVNVTATGAGSFSNSTGAVSTGNTGSGTAASASLVVMAPPTVIKSFFPTSVLVNTASVLTITLTNPTSNATALTGIGFSDSYPSGLVNTASPAGATTCGGTVTAANNGTALTLTGGSIPPSSSCTVTVNVTSASAGSYTNSSGPVSSGNAGTGAAASATLTTTLLAAPTVLKSFTPNNLAKNAISLLTITLTNGSSTAITAAQFTDSYPSGLVNSPAAAGATTCGGTVSATNGGSSVGLSGATIPANGSCTVTVNVTSAAAGAYANSTGLVTSSNASPGAAAGDTLTVLNPPTVAETFTASSVVVNQTSLLTITLTNPNSTAITGAAFSDNYPSNLVNTASAGGATSCVGGSVTASNGGNSLALSGATIPAGGSCTVTVNTTSAVPGSYSNSTGSVTTGNAGSAAAASATLTTTLQAAPVAVKTFVPTQIAKNGTSLLTVTLTNPSSLDITGVAFSDTLPTTPAQMSVATSSVLSSDCGGTGTIAANKLSFSLSGGTIPAGGSCSVSVTVTAPTLGAYNNTTSTVTSNNSATGAAASATLTVALLAPPTVLKNFTPGQIGIGGSSLMTITLTNPNNTAITGAAFTDSYPSGLVNAATPGAATSCTAGTVSALANGNALTLSSAGIPANSSCTVTVNVTSATTGAYANSTGAVTTSNANSGSSASATLNVLQAPVAVKAFVPAAVPPSVVSVLTVTLSNPNAIAITGAFFSDSYPSGLVNTATPGGATTCTGGTVTAALNGNSLALAGATIPGNSSCTVTVNVKSATTGSYTNSTGSIGSGNAGTGSSASGVLVVMVPPTVAKSFLPAAVQTNSPSTLTITLTNPNSAAISGAGFTDSYPSGLINMAVANGATSCSGGTVTAANSGNSLALSGGSVPANGSCTVTASVTSASVGSYSNSSGAVSTGNAGSGNSASASLNAYAAPTVAKSFGVPAIPAGGSTTLVLTLANPASNLAALSGVQVDDSFPAGLSLQNASFSFIPAACGTVTKTTGAVSAAGDTGVRFSVASLALGATCQVLVNVTSSSAGLITNTTNAPIATGPATLSGTSANAALTVNALPLLSILKSADRGNANPGQVVVYTIQIVNSGAGAGTSVVLTDDLSPYGSFFLGGGAPFSFIDSSPASGLSLGAAQYSKDKGTTWVYTPVSAGGAAPAGYDGNVTNWRIPMTGSIRAGGSAILNYQIVVK